jgi:hypothetical protein
MAPFFFCFFSLFLAPSDAAWAYSGQSHQSNRTSPNRAGKLIAKEGKSGVSVASHHLEPSRLLLLRFELLLLLLFGLSQNTLDLWVKREGLEYSPSPSWTAQNLITVEKVPCVLSSVSFPNPSHRVAARAVNKRFISESSDQQAKQKLFSNRAATKPNRRDALRFPKFMPDEITSHVLESPHLTPCHYHTTPSVSKYKMF